VRIQTDGVKSFAVGNSNW